LRELETHDVSLDEIIAESDRKFEQLTEEEYSQYKMKFFEIYTSKCSHCKRMNRYCTCV
jgi:hypothetical protein